jgi:cytochrome c biogenesis protein CcmG, thiol:disulfide interchange protein DsbE
MRIKTSIIFLSIIFVIIFFIFYKGLQNPNIYTPSVNIKKNIPSFEAKIFGTNNTISSKEIFKENKFYLMNVWASWCVPCQEEHVFLINLSKEENLKIIGLNYKDNIKKAQIFLNERKNPYEIIISDPNGIIAIEWGAYGVPETFLISNKKVIKKIIGPLNRNSALEIERLIQ